jgi:formamidopyrimidine-DNA glycosylase
VPELPEVETVRRSLLPLVGHRLQKVEIPDGRLRYPVRAAAFKNLLGQKVTAISRHGKYLSLCFASEKILFHLGMTGRLLLRQRKASPYLKVAFVFNGMRLDFIDVRRFAFVLTGDAANNALPQGPDAYNKPDFSAVVEKIRASKAEIKALLLNQNILAGLGNIYVCEILFLAGVHPARRGISLTAGEWLRIQGAIPRILKKAINSKGSSISDFVYSLPGEKEYSTGNYQKKFLVYGRVGEACKQCKTPVKKIAQSGRSTFFCPGCQPK